MKTRNLALWVWMQHQAPGDGIEVTTVALKTHLNRAKQNKSSSRVFSAVYAKIKHICEF